MKNLRKLKSWDFARPEKPQFSGFVEWSSFSQLADKVYLVLMIAKFPAFRQATKASVVSAIMIFYYPSSAVRFCRSVFVDRWSKGGAGSNKSAWRSGIVNPSLLWLTQDQPWLGCR